MRFGQKFRWLSALSVVALASTIATAQSIDAQSCDLSVASTTPTERFVISADGVTVFDQRTGLTWLRCPLGSVPDDNGTAAILADDRCVPDGGTAELGWQAALQAAADFDSAVTWRVPNIKELVSIVERQCTGPATNQTVFPNTPIGGFWSSSPLTTRFAYVLEADDGRVSSFSGNRATDVHSVRLVR